MIKWQTCYTPIDLGLPTLKVLGAKWLVKMSDYISENPHIIVKGFFRSGIAEALDDSEDTDMSCDESEEFTDESDTDNTDADSDADSDEE